MWRCASCHCSVAPEDAVFRFGPLCVCLRCTTEAAEAGNPLTAESANEVIKRDIREGSR